MAYKKRKVLKVIENIKLDKDGLFFHLVLESPKWKWIPGQFLMIKPIAWEDDPFLPRPFSIADMDESFLHIYYQVVGRGTRLMSLLKKKDEVLVWGPLGCGFEFNKNEDLLLLAGGMGIIPFLGLVNHHPNPDIIELIFGHRHPLQCYPYKEISEKVLAWNIMDNRPKDLEKLKKAIMVKIENYAKFGKVFACGPKPFLKMVHEFVIKYKAKAQFSLESVMACGIGACLGCVIVDKDNNFVQVCQKGPVFDAHHIVF